MNRTGPKALFRAGFFRLRPACRPSPLPCTQHPTRTTPVQSPLCPQTGRPQRLPSKGNSLAYRPNLHFPGDNVNMEPPKGGLVKEVCHGKQKTLLGFIQELCHHLLVRRQLYHGDRVAGARYARTGSCLRPQDQHRRTAAGEPGCRFRRPGRSHHRHHYRHR